MGHIAVAPRLRRCRTTNCHCHRLDYRNTSGKCYRKASSPARDSVL